MRMCAGELQPEALQGYENRVRGSSSRAVGKKQNSNVSALVYVLCNKITM
jgi:hypothetical protein